MRPHEPPEPTYAFGYRKAPKSGNEINGLGLTARTRANKVFHNPGGEAMPWDALDQFFALINPRGVVRHILANMWQLRRRDGPLNPNRVEVPDPLLMSARIKEKARDLGADLVGITRLSDDDLYIGAEVPYRYAVCLALRMDREEMRFVPQPRAAVEVLRVYRAISRIAIEARRARQGAGLAGESLWQPQQHGSAPHPAGRPCRSRPARQARIADQQGARIEYPARHRGH